MTAIRQALAQLRARRGRAVLAAGGVAAAAAMLGAAVTVGDSLAGGFDRAASAAHLPPYEHQGEASHVDRFAGAHDPAPPPVRPSVPAAALAP